ncbi:MAG: polysaccharide biosynthesis/export family protein [Bacteroidales bacterium]|nr:polysaccharide biosynthesis/export family protein [Bacteroidales bacterium]
MKKAIYLTLLATALLTSACKGNKDIAYLQNMKEGVNYPFEPKREIVLQENDLLAITVTCPKPELALPFNSRNGAVAITDQGNLTAVSDGSETQREGYRIDPNGNIHMPILGKIHAEGMYMDQLEDEIRQRIIDGDYILDPQVSVALLNFKYTVLGAVGHSGTFTADGDRVTLLEALAKAGDITANGDHKKVAVIREVDGKRLRIDHDMRNLNTLNSPHFFLQPNDIVYVEPKYKKKDNEDRRYQFTATFLSIITAICSVIWATK